MPKIYEKGNAQKVASITGNSLQGKGYAQLKDRAVPKIFLKVVLLWILRFLPTILLLGRGMPPMMLAVINKNKIKRVTKMGITNKKNRRELGVRLVQGICEYAVNLEPNSLCLLIGLCKIT